MYANKINFTPKKMRKNVKIKIFSKFQNGSQLKLVEKNCSKFLEELINYVTKAITFIIISINNPAKDYIKMYSIIY